MYGVIAAALKGFDDDRPIGVGRMLCLEDLGRASIGDVLHAESRIFLNTPRRDLSHLPSDEMFQSFYRRDDFGPGSRCQSCD